MRQLFGRVLGSLTAVGQPARKRALRISAELLMAMAVLLLSTAAVLASNRPPARRPFPTGVVFNLPLATAAAAATAGSVPLRVPAGRRLATNAPATETTPSPQTPEPTPEPSAPAPAPPPSAAAVAKVMIPAIKVSAPVSPKGVDRSGVMEDPNSWNDLAYYDFSGRPGFGPGNNAVFAGHVDYVRHGPAVFWDLNKLKPGDEIRVQLQDGTDYSYRVTQMVVYPADTAPVEAIIGDTPNESVTLITCNGTFSAGHYNNRLIVRAERAV